MSAVTPLDTHAGCFDADNSLVHAVRLLPTHMTAQHPIM